MILTTSFMIDQNIYTNKRKGFPKFHSADSKFQLYVLFFCLSFELCMMCSTAAASHMYMAMLNLIDQTFCENCSFKGILTDFI